MSDNGRDIIPRNEYEYPLAVKAEAIAIVWATGNCSDAYREMKRRYPERYPGRDLIWRWANSLDSERFNDLQRERKAAVESRAVDLALLSTDLLEEELGKGNIKGQTLAVTTGIIMDKVLKLLEIEKRGGGAGAMVNVQFNLVTKDSGHDSIVEPEVVEAKVVEVVDVEGASERHCPDCNREHPKLSAHIPRRDGEE